MIEDEKKYDDLIKTLKDLQQVKAPQNFEADLKRRLNAEKYAKEEKRKIKRFFAPSRLVPSFGLAAAAIVIFLMVDTNSEEVENPFLMEPKIREDIMLVSDKNEVVVPKSNLSEKSDMAEKDVFADKTRQGYINIVEDLTSRGAEGVVLGCTEIPLLLRPEHIAIPSFSTTELHCAAAIELAIEPN